MRKCPIPWGTRICEENGPNKIFQKNYLSKWNPAKQYKPTTWCLVCWSLVFRVNLSGRCKFSCSYSLLVALFHESTILLNITDPVLFKFFKTDPVQVTSKKSLVGNVGIILMWYLGLQELK